MAVARYGYNGVPGKYQNKKLKIQSIAEAANE
jgi:hypothetical protein